MNVKGMGIQLISGSLLQFNHEPGVENPDLVRLENMPETRKCVAAFRSDNVKKKLIADFIRTLQSELIPQLENRLSLK